MLFIKYELRNASCKPNKSSIGCFQVKYSICNTLNVLAKRKVNNTNIILINKHDI